MRSVAATGIAIVLTVASAFFLYSETTATRRLDAQVQAAEKMRDRLEEEIAALRAERAWLARPARIEPAARAIGMAPTLERRSVSIDDLADLPPTKQR